MKFKNKEEVVDVMKKIIAFLVDADAGSAESSSLIPVSADCPKSSKKITELLGQLGIEPEGFSSEELKSAFKCICAIYHGEDISEYTKEDLANVAILLGYEQAPKKREELERYLKRSVKRSLNALLKKVETEEPDESDEDEEESDEESDEDEESQDEEESEDDEDEEDEDEDEDADEEDESDEEDEEDESDEDDEDSEEEDADDDDGDEEEDDEEDEEDDEEDEDESDDDDADEEDESDEEDEEDVEEEEEELPKKKASKKKVAKKAVEEEDEEDEEEEETPAKKSKKKKPSELSAGSLIKNAEEAEVDFLDVAEQFLANEEEAGGDFVGLTTKPDKAALAEAKAYIKLLESAGDDFDELREGMEKLIKDKNYREAIKCHLAMTADDDGFVRRKNAVYLHDNEPYRNGIPCVTVDEDKMIIEDEEGNKYQITEKFVKGSEAMNEDSTFFVKPLK